MKEKKTYYSGVVTFRYVSDTSLSNTTIEDILVECDTGCAVGGPVSIKEEPISEHTAKRLLVEYGSDENFFGAAD